MEDETPNARQLNVTKICHKVLHQPQKKIDQLKISHSGKIKHILMAIPRPGTFTQNPTRKTRTEN